MGYNFRRRKGKKNTKAKKITYDGITFASGLEKYTYQALKKAKIKADYEPTTFELIPSFHFPLKSYERQSNGKGDMVNRGEKKVLGMKYTPDFVGENFVIECKGYGTDTFNIRWKIFKYMMKDEEGVMLFKPQTKAEVDKMILLILEEKNGRQYSSRKTNARVPKRGR